MKTRYSLVSNSSSTSFICNKRLDVIAPEMWKFVNNKIDDGWNKKTAAYHKKILSVIKKAVKRSDVFDGSIGLYLPTGYEDTYMMRSENLIYISTSRNYQWDSDIEGLISFNTLEDEKKIYKLFANKFFFYADCEKLLTFESVEIPKDATEQFYCPKCKSEDQTYRSYGENYSTSECLVDPEGNKYCECHHVPLKLYKPFKKER